MCGTNLPSLSLFNFTDKQPTATSNAVATPITAMCINSNYGLVGTQGGTIFIWDIASNKQLAKMSGHLTQCTCLQTEKSDSPNVLVSGSSDTNVKLWDTRMRAVVNTYKGHTQDVVCVDLSPDQKIIASGSQDGTLRFWDTSMHKLVKKIKVGSTGYPSTAVFNPNDLCIAVGTTSRQVKYYELSDYTLVSSSTIQDSVPRRIEFVQNSPHDGVCFVGFDDSTKAFQLDVENGKPRLLDYI